MSVREAACQHARENPTDAAAQVAAAYACDGEGFEADAAGYYDAAYALGERRGEMLIGYGSTLKCVGRLADSERILREAAANPAVASAARAFLGLTLHAAGRNDEAIAALVTLIAEQHVPDLVRYRRALTFYAGELAPR